jgi:hypothetical protein
LTKAPIRIRTLGDSTGRVRSRFWKTIDTITEYCRSHIKPLSNVEELTDLVWSRAEGEAHGKRAQALQNYALMEGQKIFNALLKQTASDQLRTTRAIADKMESEARISQTKEMFARIKLLERCRSLGVVPMWSKSGQMVFIKAGEDFNWDQLALSLGLQGMSQTRLDRPEPGITPDASLSPRQSHREKP